MTGQVRACAEWFRERPAFQRILTELRKKYKRYGQPSGKVVIADASEAECNAAHRALLCAYRGLDLLETQKPENIRLAILSANASGDSHAFDSISSCVTQTGLVLETAEGKHPAYGAFREARIHGAHRLQLQRRFSQKGA